MILGVSLFCSAVALAQSPKPDAERPWAKGVAQKDQQAALALFRDGNSALKESLFVQAAQKYREAITLWPHPAIHYNLSLVLLNLDQPVEVHKNLIMAMRYGAAPLDSDKFEQATRYKRLVEAQLATVDVRCELEGAQVVMDGQPLFTGPGKYEGVVRAGPHTIVASREGFLTETHNAKLPAGETSLVELKLFTANDLTQYKRRWSNWVPWTVVGAGAAAVGLGAAMHLSARGGFETYDQGIASCGSEPDGRDRGGGCIPNATLLGQRQSAETSQTIAMGAYGLGAAALVTGGVLAYMNRLQPYSVAPGETQVEVTFAPALSPAGGGAAALVRF